MIVDDNEKMRRMIREALSGYADNFIECSNGADAINAYPDFQPDGVAMDVMMEPMDGISATRAITANFPDANIVIVTQYDEQRLRDAAKRAGAKGFILKENLDELPEIFAK
ncbi:MAG: response regulator transcription factor [Bacteroidota bacterium]